jgi:hypothetical protein
MSKNQTDYLKHILEECLYIKRTIDPGLSKDSFLSKVGDASL